MLVFFGLSAAAPGWAQLQKLPSAIAKEMLQNTMRHQAFSAPSLSLEKRLLHLQHLQKNQFKELDVALGAYFLSYCNTMPPEVLAQNEKWQQAMVRHWLALDFYVSQHQEQLNQNVSSAAVQGKIPYADYIPEKERLVLLGEIHGQKWIRQEIISLLEQLKRKTPTRPIYYASEFLFADSDSAIHLLEKADIDAFKVVPQEYDAFFQRILQTGVQIVGLETAELRLKKEEVALPPWQTARIWKAFSPVGMYNRNLYWAQRIKKILEENPTALVVVHAGISHLNYNQIHSLPRLLKELDPFVMEFSLEASINPIFDKAAPMRAEVLLEGTQLRQANPEQPVFFVRRVTDKRTAWILGCDVSIKSYFHRPMQQKF